MRVLLRCGRIRSGVDAEARGQRGGVVGRQGAGHADQLYDAGVGDLVAGEPAVAAGGDKAAVGQARRVAETLDWDRPTCSMHSLTVRS